MHLQMVEQILKEQDVDPKDKNGETVLLHRKQAGIRLRVMWNTLRKHYPDMLRQP